MNATPADSSERLPSAASSALKVTVLYEDFASGTRAKHFSENLAERLGSSCPLAESLWRCDLLEYPPIAADVARSAANSAYLIIALQWGRALPLAARAWLENQLELAARCSTSLVVLLLHPGGQIRSRERFRAPGDVHHHLRSLCEEQGVLFFCSAEARPSDELVAALRQRKAQSASDPSAQPQTCAT